MLVSVQWRVQRKPCLWCRLQVRCGQGKAHEEVFGCGKSNREQRWWPANRTVVACLGYDLVQLLVGELVVSWWLLCTVQTSSNIQGSAQGVLPHV